MPMPVSAPRAGLHRLAARWRTGLAVVVTVVLTTGVVAARLLPGPPTLTLRTAIWVVLTLVSSVGLALVVIRPGVGAAVALLSHGAHVILGQPADWSAVVVVAGLYAVIRSDRPRRPWLTATAAVVAIGILRGAVRGEPDVLGNAANEVVLFVVVTLLAELARRRRQRMAALEERTVVLERLRELEAAAAVAGERARMARELHDVLAHAISAIVLQAGAGRRAVRRRPDDAEAAFTTIEVTGREAMDELRRMVGAVRADPALTPAPSITDLTSLVHSAGLPVRVIETGVSVPLAPGHDLAAYRVIQEALTNVRKHAVGAREALVELRWTPESLAIVIRDDGAPAPARQGSTQSGFGLVGMRERVVLYNGTLDAGPDPAHRGWLVQATLPLHPELFTGGPDDPCPDRR